MGVMWRRKRCHFLMLWIICRTSIGGILDIGGWTHNCNSVRMLCVPPLIKWAQNMCTIGNQVHDTMKELGLNVSIAHFSTYMVNRTILKANNDAIEKGNANNGVKVDPYPVKCRSL
mmetsp:Transcript_29186/g.53402  ORF Transcript_29186/g.53402 Transcript_29186/m.53402 type:complete len:116 (+) Transcript_29186:686-1033(+)